MFLGFCGHTNAESKDSSSLNSLELSLAKMRQITFIILAFALLIVSYSQEVQAQYVSSAQARELLQELQDARSVINVGISRLEYGEVVRNIQIKLDRFLRTSDASKHPVGNNLKNAAELYIMAYSKEDIDPGAYLSIANRALETAEKCVVNTKLLQCESIISAKAGKGKEFYNLLVSKNSSYESLLESIFISGDLLNVAVYTTEEFTDLSREEQNSVTQIILKEVKSFFQGNQTLVTIYDSNYIELLSIRQ